MLTVTRADPQLWPPTFRGLVTRYKPLGQDKMIPESEPGSRDLVSNFGNREGQSGSRNPYRGNALNHGGIVQGMRSKDPGWNGGDLLVSTEVRGPEYLHKQTLPWPGDCMPGRQKSQFPKVESESSRADYDRRRPGHGSPEAVTAFRPNYGLVRRGLDSRTRRGTASQDEEGKDGKDVSHGLYLVHEDKFLKGTGRTDDKGV